MVSLLSVLLQEDWEMLELSNSVVGEEQEASKLEVP
jgi:hypothetical protein